MAQRSTPRIATRKQPKQARSAGLVADVLQAAARVLADEGAPRFTTARVAERAGVSVGSLYQYFANKESILFRLQAEEWRRTTDMIVGILSNTAKHPLDRLRETVHAFMQSECEEAELRLALNDAAPFYRDAPEADEIRSAGTRAIQTFMQEIMPNASASDQLLVGDVVMTTLSAFGKRISERRGDVQQVEIKAGVVADMLCAFINTQID